MSQNHEGQPENWMQTSKEEKCKEGQLLIKIYAYVWKITSTTHEER